MAMQRGPALLVVAAACGSHSSGSTSPDARTGFRPDATGLGTITLTQDATSSTPTTIADALFFGGLPAEITQYLGSVSLLDPAATPPNCTATTAGRCKLLSCPQGSPGGIDAGSAPMKIDAGAITISGGPLPASGLTLTVKPGTHDYTSVQDKTAGIANADWIVFAASGGGGVPAFTASLVAPVRIDLIAPAVTSATPLAIPRSGDLALAWTGGTASQGQLVLQLYPPNTTTTPVVLECAFDPGAGSGTVPASLLQSFPEATGHIAIQSLNLEVVPAGPVDILLVENLVWAFGPFTLQ